MFGGIFSGFMEKMSDSKLASGLNPTVINGSDQNEFLEAAALPAEVSTTSVFDASYKAGETEAYALMLADQSKFQQQVAQNTLKALSTRIQHAGAMMRMENRFREMQAKHGKATVQYVYNNGKTQKNYDGYQSKFDAEYEGLEL